MKYTTHLCYWSSINSQHIFTSKGILFLAKNNCPWRRKEKGRYSLLHRGTYYIYSHVIPLNVFTQCGLPMFYSRAGPSVREMATCIGKQEVKQVLVIKSSCETKEPLTGHTGGKYKILFYYVSRNCSPLEVRIIRSSYNERSHCALHVSGLDQSLTIWAPVISRQLAVWVGWVPHRVTDRTHQRIKSKEAARPFSCWSYSLSQEFAWKQRI